MQAVIGSWVIIGDPVGKGRPRFVRATGIAYTPAKTRTWESIARDTIAAGWEGKAPIDHAVEISVVAVFARPKRLMRAKDSPGRLPHTSRPDGDNLLKAVCDSVQAAGVVRDDCQAVRCVVEKYYAAKDEGPRVEIGVFDAGD